jgi:hypothetical protein
VNRWTLVLGIVAAAAVAAAVAVTVAVRSSASPERKSVSAYITNVNAVEQEMRGPLTEVFVAYHHYATSHGKGTRTVRGLAQAQSTLATLAQRIRFIDAPPEAQQLRVLLIQLLVVERSITREVGDLARFTPKYRSLLAASSVAGAELGRKLASTPIPKAHRIKGTAKQIAASRAAFKAATTRSAAVQADAVDTYDAAIRRVTRALRGLTPPPVLAPAYRSQLAAFAAVRAAGSRLAGALRSADRSQVPALGRRFTGATRIAQTVAAQRAEVAAVRAYNNRARGVGAAQARVQREVNRLQTALP